MTNSLRAQGTLFKIGGTTVAELRSIESTVETDELDASNHDTPNAWREFVQGMKQAEFTIEGNYIPDDGTHDATTGLLSLFQAGTISAMSLVFATTPATTWTFSGFVREFSPQAPVDEILTFNAAIRVVGQPTLA